MTDKTRRWLPWALVAVLLVTNITTWQCYVRMSRRCDGRSSALLSILREGDRLGAWPVDHPLHCLSELDRRLQGEANFSFPGGEE